MDLHRSRQSLLHNGEGLLAASFVVFGQISLTKFLYELD